MSANCPDVVPKDRELSPVEQRCPGRRNISPHHLHQKLVKARVSDVAILDNTKIIAGSCARDKGVS